MPWFVWIIVSLAGTALLDLPPRTGRGEPAPLEYRTWLSSPTIDRKTGACTFTAFALVTREHLTGLRVNGSPLPPDWSWSWDAPMPEGTFGSGMMVEFIDLDTGQVIRTHEVTARCPWRNEEVWF